MPSVRTDSFLSPTVTQASLKSAINTAAQNAGLGVPYDSYNSSGIEYLVYERIYNGSTFGKVYMRIAITATLAVTQDLSTAWNAITHAGTNTGTASTSVTFAAGTTINFSSFKPASGVEYAITLMQQGSTYFTFGLLRPDNKPTWWNESTWVYAFGPTNPALSSTISVANAASPYTYTCPTDAGNDTSLLYAAADGSRDVLTGIFMSSPTSGTNGNSGKAGRFSDDVAAGAPSGMLPLSKFQVVAGTEEYWLIGNSSYAGFSLRA